jgi:CTP synthase
MQCAVIEYSRNVLGLTGANSSEFDEKTPYPVIDLMPDQKNVNELGGTMRLGSYPCKVAGGTLAFNAYKEELVNERHRHRYELNNKYRKDLENAGMAISGIYMEKNLAEIIELKDHPWFVGCQFHPEFKSRPDRPHPLFREFISAAINYSKIKGIK